MDLLASGVVTAALVAVLVLWTWDWYRVRGKGPVLILDEYRVDPAGEILIMMRGRVTGLSGWLLRTLQMGSHVSLRVTTHELRVDRADWSGFRTVCVPLSRVHSAESSFYRAVPYLMAAFACYGWAAWSFLWLFLGGPENGYERQVAYGRQFWWLIGLLVAGTILYQLYLASKRIYISVNTGGETVGISFRRSVIGDGVVDLNEALEASDILNGWILVHAAGGTPTS